MSAGTLWETASCLPADSIASALSVLGDFPFKITRPGVSTDVAAIIGAAQVELRDALRWRRAEMADADAAMEAHDRELAHAWEVADGIEIARACIRYAGSRWKLSFPATFARLEPLIHFDILTADETGDHGALERALARHFGTEMSA